MESLVSLLRKMHEGNDTVSNEMERHLDAMPMSGGTKIPSLGKHIAIQYRRDSSISYLREMIDVGMRNGPNELITMFEDEGKFKAK